MPIDEVGNPIPGSAGPAVAEYEMQANGQGGQAPGTTDGILRGIGIDHETGCSQCAFPVRFFNCFIDLGTTPEVIRGQDDPSIGRGHCHRAGLECRFRFHGRTRGIPTLPAKPVHSSRSPVPRPDEIVRRLVAVLAGSGKIPRLPADGVSSSRGSSTSPRPTLPPCSDENKSAYKSGPGNQKSPGARGQDS